MARTLAEQITELEADRTRIRTALAASQTAASSAGFSIDGISMQTGAGANIKYLREELNQVEKSLQRLYRGGRGMPVDMSQAATGTGSTDPYRSGSEVLL